MSNDTAENKLKINTLIATLGLTYRAVFVPFSQSRNAVKSPLLDNLSINWHAWVTRGAVTIDVDYSQGIGHLPKFGPLADINDRSVYRYNLVKDCCETGRYGTVGSRDLPQPELIDVLYSLLLDGEAVDYPTYEDWASNFGYEEDSRKGEKIYRTCLELGLTLRAMLGDENIKALREVYQDY